MSLTRAQYVARRAAKECVRCASPTMGTACCSSCAAVNRASCKASRDRRRAARQCLDCTAATDGKHVYCFDCREIKSWKQSVARGRVYELPVAVAERRAA